LQYQTKFKNTMKSGRIIHVGNTCDFCKKDCFLSSDNKSQGHYDSCLDGKDTVITSLNFEFLSKVALYLGIDSYTHEVQPGYLMDSGFRFDVYTRV
jgi:hypothetical protein